MRLGMEQQVSASCGGDFSRWQANARGVDLNHNFDAGFELCKQAEQSAGILGPGPGKYGGERPESEPETRSICRFIRTQPVRQLYAFHSQGEEIYYQYGEHTPPRASLSLRYWPPPADICWLVPPAPPAMEDSRTGSLRNFTALVLPLKSVGGKIRFPLPS